MDAPFPCPETHRRAPSTSRGSLVALLVMVAAALVVVLASVALGSPAGAVITGVDVASHQHPGGAPIDWRQVAGAGHRFAYVKATEGTTYTNPWFAGDYAGASNAGLYRGAYHYARPALPLSTAESQARYFVSVAGSSTGAADLPLELDLEESGGLGQADLAEWTRRFLAEVTRLTGKRPLVYTGRWFWQGYIGGYGNDIGRDYRLWTADYHCQRSDGSLFCDPATDAYVPPVYGGWGQWTFWQNYSVGIVPGISGWVDMNRFCCDAGSLQALAGGGGTGGSPFGTVDAVSLLDPTALFVGGWAIDPDSRDPIDVHVYVDGAGYSTRADGVRSDVGGAFPGFGDQHGYSIVVPVPLGARQLCIYAINVGSGVNVQFTCRSLGGDPIGVIDVATGGPGSLTVSGWALDPNGTSPTRMVVRVDGVESTVTADRSRPDLAGFGQGTAHGFTATLPATGGSHQVCVAAENAVGPGSTTNLGCRPVVVAGGSPIGVLDSVAGRPGSVSVAGWAIDPDSAAPVDVLLVLDSLGTQVRADLSRSDLAAVFPAYGAAHGFDVALPARAGEQQVCAWALNIGAGVNVLLGCRSVQVPRSDPFGAIDVVTRVGSDLRIAGWALDPDTASSIDVHVYVNGVGTSMLASGDRPDVARAFGLGPYHGFDLTRPAVGAGAQTVCIYAINVGAGGNVLLGCRAVP